VGYLLVTNDDGVDSPALVPLIRALASLREVRTVVPAEERSWISKAISRWNRVRVEVVQRDGVEVLAVVGGYPADCTNLAVHSLFDEPPDAVVSGINLGLNTGLGYFLSSGTVGAAMEGWIAGLPAFAFSVGLAGDDRTWKQRIAQGEAGDVWARAAALAADVVRDVLATGFPEGVDLLNVNFPIEADVSTRRVVTGLARVGYRALFSQVEDGVYAHDFAGAIHETADLAGSDLAAVRQGRVSITPVRLAHAADLPATVANSLERKRVP